MASFYNMNDCIRRVEVTRSTGGKQLQTSVCRLVCKIKIRSKSILSHLISDLKQVARQAKQSTRSGSLDSEAKPRNGLLLATFPTGQRDIYNISTCIALDRTVGFKPQPWIPKIPHGTIGSHVLAQQYLIKKHSTPIPTPNILPLPTEARPSHPSHAIAHPPPPPSQFFPSPNHPPT